MIKKSVFEDELIKGMEHTVVPLKLADIKFEAKDEKED
jgi:hypothetical protein